MPAGRARRRAPPSQPDLWHRCQKRTWHR